MVTNAVDPNLVLVRVVNETVARVAYTGYEALNRSCHSAGYDQACASCSVRV